MEKRYESSDTAPIDRVALELALAEARASLPDIEVAPSAAEVNAMDFKAAQAVPGLMVCDCSKVLDEAALTTLWAAGYRVLGVYFDHPTMHDQDATLEYVTRLVTPTEARGGFGIFYIQYFRDAGHSAETGTADGARALAKSQELLAPLGAWLTMDGECSKPGDLPAYGAAWHEAARPGNAEPVLYDAYFLTTEQKDAMGFRFAWKSGENTPHAPSSGYAMIQHQQTVVGGVPIDPSEIRGPDANGLLPAFAVGSQWTTWDLPHPSPVVTPVPALGPDLSLRRIIDGEDNRARILRIMYAMSDPADRALLEPGVRNVAWTCECRPRAGIWHANTRPEDGLAAIVTVNGGRFGGDPSALTSKGFNAAILPFWGEWFGEGHNAGKPWPVEAASLLLSSDHMRFIYAATEDAQGNFTAYTVEGGQVTGACAKGTHSWHLDASGAIVPEEVNDGRHVGDCQRFVRTYRRLPDGTIQGMIATSRFGGWGLGLPVPAAQPPPGATIVPPPPDDPLLTVRGVQEALTRLGVKCGPIDGIMGIQTKAGIRAFQQAQLIFVDGVVSGPTHDALVAALAKLSV